MGNDYRPTDAELLFLSIPFDTAYQERAGRFAQLLESGLDWNYLEEKLIDCRLSGFFLRNVNNANVSRLVPEQIREHFSFVMKKDLVNNLLHVEMFKELANTFIKNNIDFIVLKGMALYFTVYATSRFRFMFDIDVLVKEAQYEEAKRVLGYKDQEGHPHTLPSFDVYQQFRYIKKTEFKYMYVDIHRALLKGVRYGYFNQESVWRNFILLETGTLTIRIFSPELELMYLCVNLVKNIYSKQAYLICFCDIAETIKFYCKDLKWEYFLELVKEEKVEDEIYSILSWLYKKNFIQLPAIMEKKLRPFFKHDIFGEKDIFGFNEYSDTKFKWHLISNIPSLRDKVFLIYSYVFPSREQLKRAYPNIHGIVIYFYYWQKILRRIFKIVCYSWCKAFSIIP